MRFGVSTYLFHRRRLDRRHLDEVAAHGFESVELFATRTHFDYHDEAAVALLADWLTATGLTLHAVHAPTAMSYAGGVWGTTLSNASTNPTARRLAVSEAIAALAVARHVPTSLLVVHLGVPSQLASPTDNDAAAARQSLEELQEAAAPLGVRLAVEVIPNDLSTPDALVRLLQDDLELDNAGLCLDYGHAFLMGDLVEAIETISGLLLTTHIDDNHGANDEHLVPFDGAIDWAAALMATQKVGYEDTFLFEVADAGDPGAVLARVQRARARLEDLFG